MPYTVRISGALARYLLNHPNAALRRRLAILRENPYPPGSRSLESDDDWHSIAARLPETRAFVFGTSVTAVVYRLDSKHSELVIEFAIVDGSLVP